jgi:hypothetical protein
LFDFVADAEKQRVRAALPNCKIDFRGAFSSNDDSEDDVSMGSGASDSALSGSEGDGLSDEDSWRIGDGAGDSAESDEDF